MSPTKSAGHAQKDVRPVQMNLPARFAMEVPSTFLMELTVGNVMQAIINTMTIKTVVFVIRLVTLSRMTLVSLALTIVLLAIIQQPVKCVISRLTTF